MKTLFKLFSLGTVMIVGTLVLSSCQKEEITPMDNEAISTRGVVSASGLSSSSLIYGLSAENEIVTFVFGPPVTETSSFPITGLKSGEKILAIDTRPGTKQIYGVSNLNLLYTINPVTGAAVAVSPKQFSPSLIGTKVGMDFATANVIRLVTDTDQNYRISAVTGALVAIDRPIYPSTASINAIAYSVGSTSSFTSPLYDLNTTDGLLYQQSDTRGTLMVVGKTGLTITGEGGFDISGRTGLAFLNARGTHNDGNTDKTNDWTVDAYRLYSINLYTGEATQFGIVRPMIGITFQL